MKKCNFCQHVGSDIGPYLFWLWMGSVIWGGCGNITPFCSICTARGAYCIAPGNAKPSPKLFICPWDAAKQPDSAGDWHLLLNPPGEKHTAAMLPLQPLQRWEDWKSSGSRMELTNYQALWRLSCPSCSPHLRTRPPAVTQQAPHVGGNELIFSCYRGSSYDCDAQGQAWASHPPSLNSTKETYLSRYLRWVLPEQLLVGWRLERCWVPLPALPPPTRYKARLLAAFPADSTRPQAQVVPQLPVAHPCCCRKDLMSCWMPGCPALSMCRGLATLPITCLER